MTMAERERRIEAIGISNGSLSSNGQALEEGELDIFLLQLELEHLFLLFFYSASLFSFYVSFISCFFVCVKT